MFHSPENMVITKIFCKFLTNGREYGTIEWKGGAARRPDKIVKKWEN